jgi:hypothetical protein
VVECATIIGTAVEPSAIGLKKCGMWTYRRDIYEEVQTERKKEGRIERM